MRPRSEISRAGTCDGTARGPPWLRSGFALRHDPASSDAARLTPSVPVALLRLREEACSDIPSSRAIGLVHLRRSYWQPRIIKIELLAIFESSKLSLI